MPDRVELFRFLISCWRVGDSGCDTSGFQRHEPLAEPEYLSLAGQEDKDNLIQVRIVRESRISQLDRTSYFQNIDTDSEEQLSFDETS